MSADQILRADMSSTRRSERPRVVTAALWALLLGAVVLAGAGLLVATTSFDLLRDVAPEAVSDDEIGEYLVLRRAVGMLYAVAGAVLAFLSGRLGRRDRRYRRATVVLAVVTVVVVAALSVIAKTGIVSVIALLSVMAGAVLLTRPAAAAWLDEGEP